MSRSRGTSGKQNKNITIAMMSGVTSKSIHNRVYYQVSLILTLGPECKWRDTRLIVVAHGAARQFQHFGCQVLQDGSLVQCAPRFHFSDFRQSAGQKVRHRISEMKRILHFCHIQQCNTFVHIIFDKRQEVKKISECGTFCSRSLDR